jgi:archaellum component FlaC
MKRYLHYALIVPLLFLVACGERTDTDYTATDYDATYQDDDRYMRAELTAWLDEIDRNYEQLQSRVQTVGEDWSDDLEDLRERRDEIRRDLQGATAGTVGTPGTVGDRTATDTRTMDGDRTMGDDYDTTPGTTTQPGTDTRTGVGTTGTRTADVDYDRIRERMKDLDSDIEELRLRAITSRDEFIAEVDTRLNEIDREIESMSRRNGMATGQATTGQRMDDQTAGRTDRAPGDPAMTGETRQDRDAATGARTQDRATMDRDRTGYAMRHDDVDVEELREDREDVREALAELRAGEREFDNEHENLAEKVADLRARVKSAAVKTGTMSATGMQQQHQQARGTQDVDV